MTQIAGHQTEQTRPVPEAAPVLSVRDLTIGYQTDGNEVEVVHGVDLDLFAGETLGLVGESGSGKSSTLLGIARLLPDNARIFKGSVMLGAVDLVTADPGTLRELRGASLSVLYQDALRALNPVMRVGRQIEEVFAAHGRGDGARQTVIARLEEVGMPDPARRAESYPHQFSGGMRQRAMTAMSLAMRPPVLLADEPTTALDATIQAQVLDLLRGLAAELGSATIFVSHDLGAIAGISDRVAVMYDGRIIETGRTSDVYATPRHPYTAGLLRSVPRLDRSLHRLPYIAGQPPSPAGESIGCRFVSRCPVASEVCHQSDPPLTELAPGRSTACHHPERAATAFDVEMPSVISARTIARTEPVDSRESEVPVVSIRDGVRHFADRRGPPVRALDGVDLAIVSGEFLGLVGESGCGKSTLGRILAGLDSVDSGTVEFQGRDVNRLGSGDRRALRRRSQMIFQEPRGSLDRRMTVGDQILEGLRNAGVPRERRNARIAELLELVGLPTSSATRHPSNFSGGQAQRIAIARALSVEPRLLIADEAVASLDVSIKGQVVNLLRDLQIELGLSVLFISHDLGVVRQVSDRVAVMYLGQLVELAQTDTLFDSPKHPYTQALLSAIPVPDPVVEKQRRRILLIGDVPSPASPPSGCRFHTRCQVGPSANPERVECTGIEPTLRWVGDSHVACHFAEASA